MMVLMVLNCSSDLLIAPMVSILKAVAAARRREDVTGGALRSELRLSWKWVVGGGCGVERQRGNVLRGGAAASLTKLTRRRAR